MCETSTRGGIPMVAKDSTGIGIVNVTHEQMQVIHGGPLMDSGTVNWESRYVLKEGFCDATENVTGVGAVIGTGAVTGLLGCEVLGDPVTKEGEAITSDSGAVKLNYVGTKTQAAARTGKGEWIRRRTCGRSTPTLCRGSDRRLGSTSRTSRRHRRTSEIG